MKEKGQNPEEVEAYQKMMSGYYEGLLTWKQICQKYHAFWGHIEPPGLLNTEESDLPEGKDE